MIPTSRSSAGPAAPRWYLITGITLVSIARLDPTLAGGPNAGDVQYVVTDLGTLGGLQAYAMRINKKGQVAGDSTTSTGEAHAFLWEKGVMRDLGTLGGDYSVVSALNDRGQVAGTSRLASGDPHAFLWTGGVMQDLGTLPGGFYSVATDLNDRGQVVGFSTVLKATAPDPSFETHAFLWDGGSMIDLGTLGGSDSYANAINKSGEVAGSSDSASGEAHAVLWTDGRMVDLTVGSGGDLCGCVGIAMDVNDHGQVVGFEYRHRPPGPPYDGTMLADALLWAKGTRTLIAAGDDSSSYIAYRIDERGEVSGTRSGNVPGDVVYGFFWEAEAGTLLEWTLGSWWLSTDAMSKVGQVVGAGRTPDGELHGYVWQGGRLTDLGEEITEASDINEQGLVVGTYSFDFDSPFAETHAVLLTPVGH